MDSKRSNKIREIVRLQQILKKWRKLANSSKSTNSNSNFSNNTTNSNKGSSKTIHFLKRTLSLSDRTVSEASSNSTTVPKGYLAVSVGEEQKRFIIPTEYLGHDVFHVLLREAEEEFGFQHEGVLRIPCEVAMFETILKMVEDKTEIVFLQNSLNRVGMLGCSQLTLSHHPESPICR